MIGSVLDRFPGIRVQMISFLKLIPATSPGKVYDSFIYLFGFHSNKNKFKLVSWLNRDLRFGIHYCRVSTQSLIVSHII